MGGAQPEVGGALPVVGGPFDWGGGAAAGGEKWNLKHFSEHGIGQYMG